MGFQWMLIVVEFLLLYWQETSTRFLCEGLLSSWLHNCPVFLQQGKKELWKSESTLVARQVDLPFFCQAPGFPRVRLKTWVKCDNNSLYLSEENFLCKKVS